MNRPHPRRIAIVGAGRNGGVVAWMAAAMLRSALGRWVELVVVPTDWPRDDSLGPFGRGVIGLPDWQATPLAAALRCGDRLPPGAGRSLGIVMGGWRSADAAWFLPFGDTGAPLATVPFNQLAARLRARGERIRLTDYSLAALAAQAERYAPPSMDPRSPLSTLAGGIHLDSETLVPALARLAGTDAPMPPPLHRVHRSGATVEAIELADGQRVAADLYLDCSGPAAALIGAPDGDGWHDWSSWLPFDRVTSAHVADAAPPPPYALQVAGRDGWEASVPLPGGRTVTRFGTAATMDGVPCRQGRRTAAWEGNCVAIGAAACTIEPLLGFPLLLAHRAITRLIDLLPHAAQSTIEAAEYNRLSASAADRARDAVIALYRTNGRVGERLWGRMRAMAVPEPLQVKLDLFAARGRVPMHDDEILEQGDWIVLLDGQAVVPRRHDPAAAAIGDDRIAQHFARLRARLIDTVRAMPAYAELLA